MRIDSDQAEHSIEMHLPYVRKIFEGYTSTILICRASLTYYERMDIKIVPVLVGAMNKDKEMEYGNLLAPYLSREDTFTVVSSDFCHWCVACEFYSRR